MSKYRFSIITPNYNSFDLMKRYFDSLNHQTYKDFEVIIIDDASTDGSYQKLKEYAAHSVLNITLLEQEKNNGPGAARNYGITAAQGEWITFIDNDDWVDSDFLEQINLVIENYSTNCVIFDYYIQRGDKRSVVASMYAGNEGILRLSDALRNVRNHSVGKVYRLTEELRQIRFPELQRCEDVAYVCRAIAKSGTAYYLKRPMYYYWQRTTSLSNNKGLDETDMVNAFAILQNELESKYPEIIEQKSVPDLLYGCVLMMCKAGKTRKQIRIYIDKYTLRYPKWYQCEIINHLGKAKKAFLVLIRYRCIWGVKVLAMMHSKMIR